MLDTILVTANLGTYLAPEWDHFCNANLKDIFTRIDRSYLGIWSYDFSISRSVD